jgi:hypothetical protein
MLMQRPGAHHPMRFSPQALLDPFDPMKNGSWALPKEATGKYQGADLTLIHGSS